MQAAAQAAPDATGRLHLFPPGCYAWCKSCSAAGESGCTGRTSARVLQTWKRLGSSNELRPRTVSSRILSLNEATQSCLQMKFVHTSKAPEALSQPGHLFMVLFAFLSIAPSVLLQCSGIFYFPLSALLSLSVILVSLISESLSLRLLRFFLCPMKNLL